MEEPKHPQFINMSLLAFYYYSISEKEKYNDVEKYKQRQAAERRLSKEKKVDYERLNQAFELMQKSQKEAFKKFIDKKQHE